MKMSMSAFDAFRCFGIKSEKFSSFPKELATLKSGMPAFCTGILSPALIKIIN